MNRTGKSEWLTLRFNSLYKSLSTSVSPSLDTYMIEAQRLHLLQSASTKPTCYGFHIQWNSDSFILIPKSCIALCPRPPPQTSQWSLQKVLEKTASIWVESRNLKEQVLRTAFLISLGSARRMSELTALSRGDDSVQFLASGAVRLSPDKSFFMKNKSPNERWEP